MGSVYQIQIVGTTYAGSTSFVSSDTSYTPLENFALDGAVLVESTIPASNNNNDVNDFEVAVSVGNVLDTAVAAGEIQFVTNTAQHIYFAGNSSQLAAIDLVDVNFDSVTGSWGVQVNDQNTARISQLNTFNTTSSLISSPKQILLGEVKIQFSQDLQQIQGTVTFAGSGLIEPGTYLYQAQFSGTLVSSYTGLAEAGLVAA